MPISDDEEQCKSQGKAPVWFHKRSPKQKTFDTHARFIRSDTACATNIPCLMLIVLPSCIGVVAKYIGYNKSTSAQILGESSP